MKMIWSVCKAALGLLGYADPPYCEGGVEPDGSHEYVDGHV